MRIGLVLEHLDPQRGGLESWTWRFAKELIRRGHDVHVVAKSFAQRVWNSPITPHRVEAIRSPVGFAEAAEAKLHTLRFDIIHDMGSGWYCDVFQPHGGSWLSVTDRKLLLVPPWMRRWKKATNRMLPRQQGFRALLARQYANRGQTFVALSQAVSTEFQRLHSVPRDRIRIVYNGVDTDRFSPCHRAKHRRITRHRLGIGDETLMALIVAHNFRLKGVPVLLRAMPRLAANRVPIHLVVVGGRRVRHWQRVANRLGIATSVTFAGPTSDTVPYYAAADIYVHPTLYDPCSLVLLEAAASGLPIITTVRCNGAAELFRNDLNGLLLSDPQDADQLADRMRTLLDDSLRARIGNSLRQTASNHTMGCNVDEMLKVYREVVQTTVDDSAIPLTMTKRYMPAYNRQASTRCA